MNSTQPTYYIGLPNQISETFSRLGGVPTFKHAEIMKHSWLHRSSLVCRLCNTPLYFIMQVSLENDEIHSENGTLPTVYIFMCNTAACSHSDQSIQAFFVVKTRLDNYPKPGNAISLDQLLKGSLMIQSNEGSGSMKDFELNTESKPFPVTFIKFKRPQAIKKKETAPSKPEYDDPTEYDQEQYESTYTKAYTKTFAKFEKELEQDPWQLIRCRISHLDPLYYSELSNPTINSICIYCSRRSVSMQLQLMPAILSILPTEDPEYLTHTNTKDLIRGMDWRTIFIYTCNSIESCPGWQAINDENVFYIGKSQVYIQSED
jgi:hypothetical protein